MTNILKTINKRITKVKITFGFQQWETNVCRSSIFYQSVHLQQQICNCRYRHYLEVFIHLVKSDIIKNISEKF